MKPHGDFSTSFPVPEKVVNGEKGAFAAMLDAEMKGFVDDMKEHFWRMQEDYWRTFSGWPWWRQMLEIAWLRPFRYWSSWLRWKLLPEKEGTDGETEERAA